MSLCLMFISLCLTLYTIKVYYVCAPVENLEIFVRRFVHRPTQLCTEHVKDLDPLFHTVELGTGQVSLRPHAPWMTR
jgi:hypothetical protein